MANKNELPEMVLEAYDTIEKLLAPTDQQPIFSNNSVTSNCLLMILNDLYETKPKTS